MGAKPVELGIDRNRNMPPWVPLSIAGSFLFLLVFFSTLLASRSLMLCGMCIN
jgi:hypothetical protein